MSNALRNPRFAAPLGAAVLAIFVSVGLAVADSTTITDGKDAKGGIDIKSAKAGHTKTGKLRHVLVFYGTVPPKGETGNECLSFWKSKPHQLPGAPPGAYKEAPYKVCGPQTGKRPIGTGGEDNTPFHKTGTAVVTRSGNTLTFTFPKKAIGNPKKSYFWKASASFYGAKFIQDLAPDGKRVVKHTL